MKRIPFFLVLLLLFPSITAQTERAKNIPGFDLKTLHFGFTVGLNAMDMNIKRNYSAENFLYADMTHISYGFQVGAISDLRLSDNWNLRFLPGISFGSRQVYYYEYDVLTGQVGDLVSDGNVKNPASLGPAFLDFPLQLKYRSNRENNYRPYVIGGINFRYDMSAKKEYQTDGRHANEYVKFKPADLYLEVGFGVDTYLKYFKFAPEIKLAVGLLNVITDDPQERYPQFVTSIERATSYMILLNFHFE